MKNQISLKEGGDKHFINRGIFQMVFFGDEKVGKGSIISNVLGKKFNPMYIVIDI